MGVSNEHPNSSGDKYRAGCPELTLTDLHCQLKRDYVGLFVRDPSALCSLSTRRRRLQSEEDLCGIDAIIAACREAFNVTACECIEHSDGGCPVTILEAVANGTETAGTTTNSADGSSTAVSSSSSGSSSSEVELTVAEVGADGRLLQESGQAITTDLEVYFTTDSEVRKERKSERAKERNHESSSHRPHYYT